jgi:hypothetical protein
MARACPTPREGCPYVDAGTCHLSEHHEYYPANEYKSELEKAFRTLPMNIVELRRCDHDDVHRTQEPPEKPRVEEMAKAIIEYRNPNHTSVRRRKLVQKLLTRVDI